MVKFDYQNFKQTPLPTEKEIMVDWGANNDSPLISVLCTTFNQQAYIEDAIRGFLIQKTDFKFEIVIHDDASTDNTPDILKEYAKLYPNLIKLILQKENQYSQGKRIFSIAATYAKGKYLAFCEGDDFWIGSNKLSHQKNIFDLNAKCSLVVHQCLRMTGENINYKPAMNHGGEVRIIGKKEVIGTQNQFSPTASYLIKKEVFQILPEWVESAPVGDYFLECYSLKLGNIIYMPEVLSIYRVNAIGSWSADTLTSGGKRSKFSLRMYESLKLMNKDEFFRNSNLERKMSAALLDMAVGELILKNYKGFKESIDKSNSLYSELSKAQRLLYFLRSTPSIARMILVSYKKVK